MSMDIDTAPIAVTPPERPVSVPDLTGADYLQVLGGLHHFLLPETYLEIGVWTGRSLGLAQCASIAIDPEMLVSDNVIGKKPVCHFYQMSSDQFFRKFNPGQILGRSIDIAFIDGLHYWEVLLRDFMNTERYCERHSIIAMHDCVPTDVYIAERQSDYERRKALSPNPGRWAGDLWKVLPVLKRFRPDLTVYVLDALPTGLVLVTGLSPTSTVLDDAYFAILDEFRDVTLLDYGIDRFFSEINLLPASNFRSFENLRARFAL